MKTWIVTLNTLESVVPEILEALGSSKVVVLAAEMGAGKTTLIAAICKYLKVKDTIGSPTYSIINEYHYEENQLTKKVFHMDLYRLKSEAEALDIGIEDYLFSNEFCFIEWPQIIENLLPENIKKIDIQINEDLSRKIILL